MNTSLHTVTAVRGPAWAPRQVSAQVFVGGSLLVLAAKLASRRPHGGDEGLTGTRHRAVRRGTGDRGHPCVPCRRGLPLQAAPSLQPAPPAPPGPGQAPRPLLRASDVSSFGTPLSRILPSVGAGLPSISERPVQERAAPGCWAACGRAVPRPSPAPWFGVCFTALGLLRQRPLGCTGPRGTQLQGDPVTGSKVMGGPEACAVRQPCT